LDEVIEIAENPIGTSPSAALAVYYEIQAQNYKCLGRDADSRVAAEKFAAYRQKAKELETVSP
jgi:hypothetical protein